MPYPARCRRAALTALADNDQIPGRLAEVLAQPPCPGAGKLGFEMVQRAHRLLPLEHRRFRSWKPTDLLTHQRDRTLGHEQGS